MIYGKGYFGKSKKEGNPNYKQDLLEELRKLKARKDQPGSSTVRRVVIGLQEDARLFRQRKEELDATMDPGDEGYKEALQGIVEDFRASIRGRRTELHNPSSRFVRYNEEGQN